MDPGTWWGSWSHRSFSQSMSVDLPALEQACISRGSIIQEGLMDCMDLLSKVCMDVLFHRIQIQIHSTRSQPARGPDQSGAQSNQKGVEWLGLRKEGGQEEVRHRVGRRSAGRAESS